MVVKVISLLIDFGSTVVIIFEKVVVVGTTDQIKIDQSFEPFVVILTFDTSTAAVANADTSCLAEVHNLTLAQINPG